MRLIVTDVTEMHGGNFCVAGWDRQASRMVRPLPDGANWTMALLQAHGIAPGTTIDVSPTGRAHQSQFPHLTEDTPIHANAIARVNAGPVNWFGGDPPTYGTVAEAFAGHVSHNSVWDNVRQGAHVTVGTQVGSLCAISVSRNSVELISDFDKMKIVISDGLARYKLAVTSLTMKSAFRDGGLLSATNSLPASPRLHVRLGLARAFGNEPTKCYLMVNGIYG